VKQQIVEMALNASGIRDTARVLHVNPTTVIKGPRSWRRPPRQLLCEAKAPKYRKNKAFEDSSCHPEWPKVADTVIEAH